MPRPLGRGNRRVLLDSSAYLAVLDRDDQHHDEAVRVLRALAREQTLQFTTNVILIEAHALVLSRLGIQHGQAFLRDMERSATTVVRARAADEVRARHIIYQYDDKAFSMTDAISFAVMERLHITRAFTFDRHFAQYGFTVLTPDLL
ncbi:MAG TPA: PIN domain-containing protein [Chloroflexota bacterium]|nr:PIN domain-containing protein [Chloroflexota bacterium]